MSVRDVCQPIHVYTENMMSRINPSDKVAILIKQGVHDQTSLP
ncbi:hypothetical protein THPR109532_20140 [Thalassospira profundimaris]